jgi:predicted nucleic acid-binding protein
MKKLKIYLDTSVISYLDQQDASEKMQETLRFWQIIRQGKYHVYISNLALDEIGKCSQTKKDILYNYLSQISFNSISSGDEAIEVAHQIIKQGIISQKSFDDCLHLGMAITNECDVVISWNFKHMVNIKTIHGVRSISIANGYKMIDIYPPTIFINKGDD